MSALPRTTVRVALVAGLALLAAGGAASAAQAASGDLTYTCDVSLGPGAPTELTTPLTVRLDFRCPTTARTPHPSGPRWCSTP